MKISRLVVDFAVLVTVPSVLAYVLLSDETKKTEEQIAKRPDVLRAKKQHADVVRLIRDSATTDKEDKVINDLLKKGEA